MEKNNELRNAWDFVEHTGISIFLTGKAGTGKTTFLRAIREKSSKRSIVVAPTGVAAINAGGVTIHSFFQLPLSPFVPEAQIQTRFSYSKEKRKIMRTLDLLIIDEISMVRVDVLDAIDSVLRRFREHDKPFGGVQLLMIGDLQQLTPVVRPDEEALLQKYYDTPYFFGSHALKSINYVTIELSKVYRQQDLTFINILNHIRDGKATNEDLQTLNKRYNPTFQPETNSDFIRLTTHNRMADSFNSQQLNSIRSEVYTFTAKIEGQFQDFNYPADYQLSLKKGAQVMFICNDNGGKYYNGKIGHITYIDERKIQVLCPGEKEAIDVEPHNWENTKYTLNETTKQIEAEVQGTFEQYPLRLAWAITIHKSQGLTFDHAIIDAQQAFASGQVYVALSRCRTLEGLVLASPVGENAIISDERVSQYINQQSEIAEKSVASLPLLKETYYRYLLTEMFDFNEIFRFENAMLRVLSEYYYKYSKLTALHKMTIEDYDKRILSVAEKWISVMQGLKDEELHEEAFLDRVKKSALYFHSQLTELFVHLLEMTKGLESNNKAAVKRYQNTYTDLEQTVGAKRALLAEMMKEGFTTNGYLAAKQEAILEAMGEDTATASRKRKKKTQVAKVPKEKPSVVTYRLFKEGKSVEEIAKERGLVVSTIQGHLENYVSAGEIKAEEVVSKEKVNRIRRIIKAIGTQDGIMPIKNLCGNDISYSDIKLVLAEKQ